MHHIYPAVRLANLPPEPICPLPGRTPPMSYLTFLFAAAYLYSGKNTLGFLGPGSVALGGQASGGTMLQRDKRTSLSQSRVARRRKPQAWEGLVFDSEINCIAQDIP